MLPLDLGDIHMDWVTCGELLFGANGAGVRLCAYTHRSDRGQVVDNLWVRCVQQR
jgi:hypothetical protein